MVRRTEVLYFEASPKHKAWLVKMSTAKVVTIDEILCGLIDEAMGEGVPAKAKTPKDEARPDGSLRMVGEDSTGGKGPTQVIRRLRKAAPPAPKRPRKKKARKSPAPKPVVAAKPAKKAAKKPVKKAVKTTAKKAVKKPAKA